MGRLDRAARRKATASPSVFSGQLGRKPRQPCSTSRNPRLAELDISSWTALGFRRAALDRVRGRYGSTPGCYVGSRRRTAARAGLRARRANERDKGRMASRPAVARPRRFTVIAPNYRGSTGFGPEFRKANINDLGGKDLEDCLAAAEWLRSSPEIDPSRIAIMGGSTAAI